MLIKIWLLIKRWYVATVFSSVERRLLQLEVEAEHEVKKLALAQDHAKQRLRDSYSRDRAILTARLTYLGDRLQVLTQLVTKPPAQPQTVVQVTENYIDHDITSTMR